MADLSVDSNIHGVFASVAGCVTVLVPSSGGLEAETQRGVTAPLKAADLGVYLLD